MSLDTKRITLKKETTKTQFTSGGSEGGYWIIVDYFAYKMINQNRKARRSIL